MSTPAIILAVVLLLILVVVALVLRYKETRDRFDILTEAEATEEHAELAEPPARHLTVVPDGFTCLRCYENPAMPAPSVWCTVCAPIVDQYPAEPIERSHR